MGVIEDDFACPRILQVIALIGFEKNSPPVLGQDAVDPEGIIVNQHRGFYFHHETSRTPCIHPPLTAAGGEWLILVVNTCIPWLFFSLSPGLSSIRCVL